MNHAGPYEIHYTWMGEPHTDIIEDLDVAVIDVVKQLARKNHVAVNDDIAPIELAQSVAIADVSVHSLEDDADGLQP